MSNYRVRQVLALGPMRESQLRLLVALATWMNDDSRIVRAGFDVVQQATGNVRSTVRKARDELREANRLSWASRPGRGHLTVWTVLCLPVKGVSETDPDCGSLKGVNDAAEKGSTEPEKRVTYPAADLREPEQGLNRVAKPSGSLSAALQAAGATERETDFVIEKIRNDPSVKSPAAYLRAAIANGDAPELIAEAGRTIRSRQQQATDDQFERAMQRAQAREEAAQARERAEEQFWRDAAERIDLARWREGNWESGTPVDEVRRQIEAEAEQRNYRRPS